MHSSSPKNASRFKKFIQGSIVSTVLAREAPAGAHMNFAEAASTNTSTGWFAYFSTGKYLMFTSSLSLSYLTPFTGRCFWQYHRCCANPKHSSAILRSCERQCIVFPDACPHSTCSCHQKRNSFGHWGLPRPTSYNRQRQAPGCPAFITESRCRVWLVARLRCCAFCVRCLHCS